MSLIEAVERNDVKAVIKLLTNGIDVHFADDFLLWMASFHGHVEMISLLLNAGADVHAENDHALQLASQKGHVEVVALLLNAGADVHAENDHALQLASQKGHVEVVSLLLNAGANPEKCSKEMLVKVKEHVCSQLMDIDLPTCLKNTICKILIGY